MVSSSYSARCLAVSLIIHGTAANNGYVASFTGKSQLAGTKAHLLSSSNAEIARLAAGFTISVWARFNDASPSVLQPTVQIFIRSDGNFMQPFGGMHGGFEFTSGAVSTVSTLPAGEARNWHHYAVAWNTTSGVVAHYIDGTSISTTTVTHPSSSTWLSEDPFIILGMSCYPEKYYTDEYTECNPGFQLDGEVCTCTA